MNQTSQLTQVSLTYRHYDKVIRFHGVTHPSDNQLKWYDIARSDQPIEHEIRDLARAFLSRQMASVDTPSAQELGFVLLHRCGEGCHFLMLCTWRENNELWKTTFYLDADTMTDFAHFPQKEPLKGTFCVWEMAVVSHETQAWTAYLLSDRTDQDADTYLTSKI